MSLQSGNDCQAVPLRHRGYWLGRLASSEEVHGTFVMDKRSAALFKSHMELAIKELSSALVLTKEVSTPAEFIAIRKPIGHLIAAVDEILHESVYPDHPELNELRHGPNRV